MGRRIELTEGIVGGFVPAKVRRKIVIHSPADNAPVEVRDSRLVGDDYREATAKILERNDFQQLVSEISQIRHLPVEQPTACEDIYGMDTQVHVHFDDGGEWVNHAPQGCAQGASEVSPDENQALAFARIVETIKAFSEKHAK